jgi:glycine/D-amino acid oxidase-like deaminating enzyme
MSWFRDTPSSYADEARKLEPALPPELAAGLYLPEEAQVNSPRLVRALAFAARWRGAGVEEATPVTGLLTEGSRVAGVETLLGAFSAGAVVLAGGDLGAPLSEELGVRLPVHPVKGEILTVRADPAPTAPCGDIAPPVIDETWGCLLRRPGEEDRGHRQARVRLSMATWGNIIATRYRPQEGTQRKSLGKTSLAARETATSCV